MMDIKISIVIPAYNVSKYIGNTIESTLNQTFQDYEVIVVDDGSKDDTGEICRKYVEGNAKLRVIHQENGGVMAARLKGLKHSYGEWITFLDGDDILPRNSLEILYSHVSNDTDIVLGTINHVTTEGKLICKENLYRTEHLTAPDYAKYISKYPRALHGVLYRKSILNGVSVDRKIVNNEDQIFNVFLTSRVRNVFVTKETVHNYIIRPDSISKRKYSADYWYMMIDYVNEHYKEYDVKDAIYRRYILSRICSLMRNSNYELLDYKHSTFNHLRILGFSRYYGTYGNAALAVLKHPNSVMLSMIRIHPKLLITKLRRLFR